MAKAKTKYARLMLSEINRVPCKVSATLDPQKKLKIRLSSSVEPVGRRECKELCYFRR
jgi:hypothetical protein